MTDLLPPSEHFATIFHRLTEVYNEPYSRLKIEAYWQVLGPEDLGLLDRAADRWIAEEERFPRPVEWRRVAREIGAADRARRPRLSEESTVFSDTRRAEILGQIREMKERLGWLEDKAAQPPAEPAPGAK